MKRSYAPIILAALVAVATAGAASAQTFRDRDVRDAREDVRWGRDDDGDSDSDADSDEDSDRDSDRKGNRRQGRDRDRGGLLDVIFGRDGARSQGRDDRDRAHDEWHRRHDHERRDRGWERRHDELHDRLGRSHRGGSRSASVLGRGGSDDRRLRAQAESALREVLARSR